MHTLTDYVQQIATAATGTVVTDSRGNDVDLEAGMVRCIDMLREAGNNNAKVLLIANGGSAAIAPHVQNDLVKACGIRAMVFTEQPLLTALANDDGYETVYDLPTDVWAEVGDVMIAISSSGNSENILRAVGVAKKREMTVITLSGFDEGIALRKLGDVNLYSDSSEYGVVENVHSILTHSMTDSLKSRGK